MKRYAPRICLGSYAEKNGIDISADKRRVIVIGSQEKDTLYAFCGNKIWKRKIQQHALGAQSPWTKVVPNKL